MKQNILGIMARDQYGEVIHLPSKHPRKHLLSKLGRQHVAKMYVDTKDGSTKHIGYIVSKRWFTLYNISEWNS